MSSTSAIDFLNALATACSRYCLSFLLLLGLIGLTLNTYIFTRKLFRSNSCVHYFLASTIANYFVVFFILPSRILSDGFNIDPGTSNLFYCKLRFYTYFTSKSLASWFIVLACFDRKMSSSPHAHRRAFSRLIISRWVISLTSLIVMLSYSHVLIFYEIDSTNKCNPRPGSYRLFNDIFYLIAYSTTPPFLMLIFTIWTIRDTRRFRRIGLQTNQRLSILNKRDQSLMLMIFLEVTFIVLTTLPHAIQKLYTTLTNDLPKDSWTKASDNLFIVIVRAISFASHSCTFYVLTLSGKMFRNEFLQLFKRIFFRRRQTERIAINVTRG